jgi:hypothetical protein
MPVCIIIIPTSAKIQRSTRTRACKYQRRDVYTRRGVERERERERERKREREREKERGGK